MQPTQLKPLLHRGQEQIGIFFFKNDELNLIVRKIKGVKWSQTNKCWYLLLNKASREAVKQALKEKAVIDESLLRQYLQKKKQVAKTIVLSNPQTTDHKLQTASPAWKLSKENLEELKRFVEHLKLKA